MSDKQDNGAAPEPGAGAPEPEQDPLEAELAEARARAEDNWNQYLRAAAELENTRKRARRDVEQAHRYALERFAAELLAVRDSLEMGLAAAADDGDTAATLRDGMQVTLRQLDQVLERFGVEIVDPAGRRFDPEHHEAMAVVPDPDAEPDTVVQVVQKGGLLNGRLLRPARVIVARAAEEEGPGP